VLYLPVNKRVEFVLNARDVIHSFWVPAFLVKLDMIPGKTNRLQITPTQMGEFQGKCAELCGAYHSQMLFKVKIVSQAGVRRGDGQAQEPGSGGSAAQHAQP
jgi:cytochrome c oxidase subunit 2